MSMTSVLHHSCRHRRCPTCQRLDPDAWLAERRRERRPVPYFHIVLTLTHERRALVRSTPNDLDDLGIRAAAPALSTLASAPHGGGLERGPGGPAHLAPSAGLPSARPWPGASRRGSRLPARVATGPPDFPRAGPGPREALSRTVARSGASGTPRSDAARGGADRRVGRLPSTSPARGRTGTPRRGPICPPDRPDQEPQSLGRGGPGLLPRPGLAPSRLATHAPAGPGVPVLLSATRPARGFPRSGTTGSGVRSPIPCAPNRSAA